jgi:hypothetical protein
VVGSAPARLIETLAPDNGFIEGADTTEPRIVALADALGA